MRPMRIRGGRRFRWKFGSGEEKIDAVKRQIEDDRMVQDSLRHVAENQQAIHVLAEQALTDFQALDEGMKEHNYILQKHNLLPKDELPGCRRGWRWQRVDCPCRRVVGIRSVAVMMQCRMICKRPMMMPNKTQRSCNEKSALMTQQNAQLNSCRNRLEQLEGEYGSVAQCRKIVENLRPPRGQLGAVK